MKNVLEMIDEIRENLKSSFNDYLHIPSEELRRQLLFGLQKIGRETDIFKKSASFTTSSASTRNWASLISTDYFHFKRVLSVRYGSELIDEIGFHTYADLKDSTLSQDGKTKYYIDDTNQKFGMYNFDSGIGVIVNFAGVPSVSAVSDTATPIQDEYVDDLIGMATYKMLLRSDNPQPVLLSEYRNIANMAIPHIQRTKSNTTPIGTVKRWDWGV